MKGVACVEYVGGGGGGSGQAVSMEVGSFVLNTVRLVLIYTKSTSL